MFPSKNVQTINVGPFYRDLFAKSIFEIVMDLFIDINQDSYEKFDYSVTKKEILQKLRIQTVNFRTIYQTDFFVNI